MNEDILYLYIKFARSKYTCLKYILLATLVCNACGNIVIPLLFTVPNTFILFSLKEISKENIVMCINMYWQVP